MRLNFTLWGKIKGERLVNTTCTSEQTSTISLLVANSQEHSNNKTHPTTTRDGYPQCSSPCLELPSACRWQRTDEGVSIWEDSVSPCTDRPEEGILNPKIWVTSHPPSLDCLFHGPSKEVCQIDLGRSRKHTTPLPKRETSTLQQDWLLFFHFSIWKITYHKRFDWYGIRREYKDRVGYGTPCFSSCVPRRLTPSSFTKREFEARRRKKIARRRLLCVTEKVGQ